LADDACTCTRRVPQVKKNLRPAECDRPADRLRKPPTSDAEAAALFRGISAYTGRFTVEGDRIVTEVDAAWHPAWEGTR
jgi:hypothetical protein